MLLIVLILTFFDTHICSNGLFTETYHTITSSEHLYSNLYVGEVTQVCWLSGEIHQTLCCFFLHTCCRELCVRHPLTTVNAQFSFNSLLFLPAVSAVVRSCSFRRFCSGPAGFVWKGLELHCICRWKVLVTRSLTLLCNACCFFWPRLFFNFQLKIKQKYYISSGWTFLLAQHNCV